MSNEQTLYPILTLLPFKISKITHTPRQLNIAAVGRFLFIHILCRVRLLFPLFLPQDTGNALSDSLGLLYLVFEGKILLIERSPFCGLHIWRH